MFQVKEDDHLCIYLFITNQKYQREMRIDKRSLRSVIKFLTFLVFLFQFLELNLPLHWPHPYALPSMETAVVIRRVLKSGIGSGNCCSICAILPVKGNNKH